MLLCVGSGVLVVLVVCAPPLVLPYGGSSLKQSSVSVRNTERELIIRGAPQDLSSFYAAPPATATAIDNGIVGPPQISCGRTEIDISFRTQKPFEGRVFIKGFSDQNDCVIHGSGVAGINMPISFDKCGVRRTRQANPTGIGVSTVVIVSFHPVFLTKVDKAYRINCFYMEASKTVEAEILVSMLTTSNLNEQLPMPLCRYEILAGGINGAPVRFAQIGDKVYHKWTCSSSTEDMFCMRVHSCKVGDGQGGQPYLIIDHTGCAVDKYALQNLDYLTNLMAGQEAHVFKFADKPTMFFDCQIEITMKDSGFGCMSIQPQCPPAGGIGGQLVARNRLKREMESPQWRQSFDLPEQELFVFDLPDGRSAEELKYGNQSIGRGGRGRRGEGRGEGRGGGRRGGRGGGLEGGGGGVCLATETFAGMFSLLMISVTVSLVLLLYLYLRRNSKVESQVVDSYYYRQ